MGLDPDKLAFNVFEGDETAPRDIESHDLWVQCGVPEDRIYFPAARKQLVGPGGATGPCGPDTEMFVITDKAPCGPDCSPALLRAVPGNLNDVFMQYNKQADGTYAAGAKERYRHGPGAHGAGAERQKPYTKPTCSPASSARLRRCPANLCGRRRETVRAFRIVADHIRTATFILGDLRAVTPSNVDQGYVLRRLIRRAVRFGMQLGLRKASPPISRRSSSTSTRLCTLSFMITAPSCWSSWCWRKGFQRTLTQGMREFERSMRASWPTPMRRAPSTAMIL